MKEIDCALWGLLLSSRPSSQRRTGRYKGRVQEIGGTRWSDFEMIVNGDRGTLQMYRADRVGNRPLSISVVEGVYRLEMKEGAMGCERVFELTSSGNELKGKMTFIDGRNHDVTAVRQ